MAKRELSDHPRSRDLWLTLGALGILYGDIGTSPLYALRECFYGRHGIDPSAANVLGVLSLIAWSLIVVISIKYLVLFMRADNVGEGGILALTSLVAGPNAKGKLARRGALVLMGLFGAALLYGDGMITPAISVLSAVEGLQVATPVFKPYIVPITIHYGFNQSPHIPRALGQHDLEHLQLERETAVYISGRETVLARGKPGMALWREKLFAFLARNALSATAFFQIPARQVLELGSQIRL